MINPSHGVVTDGASVRSTDLFATRQCLQYSEFTLYMPELSATEEESAIDLFVTPQQ